MSVASVFRKDFRAVRRSPVIWAAAVALGAVAALVAYVVGDAAAGSAAAVRRVFRMLALVFAVLLPLAALLASYLAVAGERESGGVKFLLSLPNSRRDVFAGKLASRLCVVAGGVAFVYVAAVSVSLTRHGALPVGVVAGTFLATLVYGASFTSVAVAVSAAVGSKSRAIAGAFGSYFLLVVLYVFPVVRVSQLVAWLHTTLLGADPNPDLYNAVRYTSPYLGYRKAVNLAVPAEMRRTVFYSSLPEEFDPETMSANASLPVYLTDEFSVVVLGFWLVVPPLAGYWLFERSDLT